MIIRHITQVKFLKSIMADGYLDPSRNPKRYSCDKEYVSFEKYIGSNALLKFYLSYKKLEKEDVFELFFDTDLMERDGIKLVTRFHNGGSHTKVELQNLLSEDEYNSVGDYIFVRGRVSLRCLTEECRNRLEDFINNM